jgi:predicted permease
LLPALRQTQLDPRDALQEEPRGASAGRAARKLRFALVAGEIALAALLCAATLLLARSAQRLDEREHGFNGDGVLSFYLSLPQAAYGNSESRARLYTGLTPLWRQLPGVEAAGLATDLPWTGYDENSGFGIVGRDNTPEPEGQGRDHAATPGYFEALRVPLLRGRLFDERDRRDSPPVLLINDILAQRYFPGENPVGRVLNAWGKPREIVGVVADIRDRPSDPQAVPAYWFPMSQEPFVQVRAALRTSGDPLAMAQGAAAALRSVDPELPLAEIRSMDTIVNAALAERRFALWLFEAFAALALALAAVGIYGLLAYLVEQRRKELGIRMALGASRVTILRIVLRDGVRLCAAGVVAGLVLVPVAGRGLASFLYGVRATDSVSLLSASVLILVVVLAASFVPAWTAARCQPMSALREE